MATAVASAEPAPRRWRSPERLPQISGAALIVYRLIWVAAAVLAVSSITFINYQWTAREVAGGRTVYNTGLAPITRLADGQHVRPFSLQSRLAGVRDNDVITMVDGRPAPDDDDGLAALLKGPDGSRITFGLRDSSGRTRTVTLTRNSNYLHDAYAGSGLDPVRLYWMAFAMDAAGNVFSLSAAALLFLRRPRDPVAALLSLGMLFYLTNVQLIGPSWIIVQTALGSLAGSMILLGLLFFPDGRLTPRWWPVAAIAVLSIAGLNFAAYWSAAALAVGPFVALVSVALCVAAVVSRFRAAEPGIARQQIKLAMLGLAAFLGFGLLTMALAGMKPLAPNEAVRAWMNLGGALSNALSIISVTSGLLVALLRYRLYDADTAIGRSAAYGAMTIGLVVLFAGSEKLIELLGQEYLGQNVGAVAGGVAAALAAVVIAPMHRRSRRWAQKRFQKALFRLRHGLPPLVGDLRETAGLEQIAGATLDALVAGVRASRAALIAGEELIDAREMNRNEAIGWWRSWAPPTHDGIDTNRSDPLFPVRVPLEAEGHGRVGWLLLGARPDGSLFGKSECRAIEEIAEPVARAVQVALRRQERETALEARLRAIESALAKLGGKAAARPRLARS